MGKPTFIIIGAERCGTTTLFNAIAQHPQFCKPYTKEIEFFDKHYDKGIAWYENQFNSGFTGEATPTYYWHPKAAHRILEYNQNIKIIFIKRKPEDAARSKYWQQVAKGVEHLSFKNAIETEHLRTFGDLLRAEKLPYNYYPALFSEYAYTKRYEYSLYLNKWKGFDMLMLDFEDIKNTQQNLLDKVFEFLGVESAIIKPEHHNKGIDYPKEKTCAE